MTTTLILKAHLKVNHIKHIGNNYQLPMDRMNHKGKMKGHLVQLLELMYKLIHLFKGKLVSYKAIVVSIIVDEQVGERLILSIGRSRWIWIYRRREIIRIYQLLQNNSRYSLKNNNC